MPKKSLIATTKPSRKIVASNWLILFLIVATPLKKKTTNKTKQDMQLLTKYTRILNLKFNFQKNSQRLNIKIKATGKLVVIGQILIAVTHHDIHALPA